MLIIVTNGCCNLVIRDTYQLHDSRWFTVNLLFGQRGKKGLAIHPLTVKQARQHLIPLSFRSHFVATDNGHWEEAIVGDIA